MNTTVVLAQVAPEAAKAGLTINALGLFVILVIWGIKKEGKDFLFGCCCVIAGVFAGVSGGIIADIAMPVGNMTAGALTAAWNYVQSAL